MIEWMNNLWNDYYALIILAIVIMVMSGIKIYKKRKVLKVPKPPKKMSSPEVTVKKEDDNDVKKHNIEKIYEELTSSNKKEDEDIIIRIGNISDEMKKTSNKLDNNINQEKIRLANMLDKVSKDRETLERLTKDMIILSKKYEDKEIILGTNLLGMKKLTEKKEEEHRIISNPYS